MVDSLNFEMKRYIQTRKVMLTSLVIFSICAFGFVQQASALSVFSPVAPGDNKLFFRDINNMENSTATVSLDKARYPPGSTATLTIVDANANADLISAEFLSVVVSSSSDPVGITIFPQETGNSTGVFVGTFKLTTDPSSENSLHIQLRDSIGVSYEPQPQFAGRFSAQLSAVDVEGFAVMSDYAVTDDEEINNCFVVVTDAVGLNFVDIEFGTPTPSSTIVTMSYSNAFVGSNSGTPTIFNQAVPEGVWLPVPSTIDLDAKTITTTGPVSTGKFVIGFPDPACSGGGGGGLVRPGLVLNLLAGLGFAGGGPDRSPPTLHYGLSNAQDEFNGTLVTDNNASFPLVINDKGYHLPSFSNFINPVSVNTGQDVNLALKFLEYTGVEHVAIHFVNETNDEMSDNDPTITYDKGNVTKSDPEGILNNNITFSTTKDSTKYSFNFGFSFDKPTNRHLMITAWDNNKNSENTKIFNAFSVSGEQIPVEGIGHLLYLDLGMYFATADGIFANGEKTDTPQPVIGYDYPDSVSRMERHDNIIYDKITEEKTRASQVMAEKFNLDTTTFANSVEPIDVPTRAPELSWSFVGHNLRDNTKTPEENKELLKELSWQEHLKAEKTLNSLLVGSKYRN